MGTEKMDKCEGFGTTAGDYSYPLGGEIGGGNYGTATNTKPTPVPSWPDAESRVRRAIKDLEDTPVSFDGNNPCVDKYRAILDAELRLLELRVKVELAEIGQADRDRIMSKLAPVVIEDLAE